MEAVDNIFCGAAALLAWTMKGLSGKRQLVRINEQGVGGLRMVPTGASSRAWQALEPLTLLASTFRWAL
jgi:hypothetical protein